jgi:cinnamyl-alcohol dehydrogenase
LDTVSAEHALLPILELLKVNGTLFIVGAPDKPLQLPAFPLIFGKIDINHTPLIIQFTIK